MKTVNLLAGKYREQAVMYSTVRTATAAGAVIFLSWLLIVLISTISIRTGEAMVYRNAALLASPEAEAAEGLRRLANEAKRREEYAERYFSGGNISLGYLDVIAAAAEGLTLAEVELNSRERYIRIRGEAADEAGFEGFTERLREGGYFHRIGVPELERREGRLSFLLELTLRDGS